MRGNGIGGLARRGDNAGALERFRAALEMRQRLAAQDPDNAEELVALEDSHVKTGDAQAASGDRDGALENYREALDIAERLAARAPGDADRPRAYVVALRRLAELPGSGVGWAEVAAAWNDMEQRGLLAFPDWRYAAEARRRAEAQKP